MSATTQRKLELMLAGHIVIFADKELDELNDRNDVASARNLRQQGTLDVWAAWITNRPTDLVRVGIHKVATRQGKYLSEIEKEIASN